MRQDITTDSQSWTEYRRLVVKSLRTLDDDITELRADFQSLQLQYTQDIVTLKLKVGIFSAIGGAISGALISGIAQIIVSHLITR